MIFAPNHVRDFHLDVIDHVYEMKNPRAIGPPDRHVRVRARIREIEINLAANEIVNNDVLTRRTEPERALVFEDVTTILKFFQVTLVNLGALTLEVRAEISADMRAFVPINSEPFEALIDRGRGFFGVAFGVGVFDSQD